MKVYLRTFGCRANHYDTEAVRAMVESQRATPSSSSLAEADVAVFNSCAVTADAEAELRKVVRRAARERPALRSVVMGCAAALDAAARPVRCSIRALPTVEHVVGGADLPQSPTRSASSAPDGATCSTRCADGDARAAARPGRLRRALHLLRDDHGPRRESQPRDRRTRSRSGRARRAAFGNCHHRHSHRHLRRRHRHLARRADEATRRARCRTVRFRLSSIEATEIDDALVELLVGAPARVAPHIHAPLQSGSDRLLKRMGRNWYTSCDLFARRSNGLRRE